MTITSRRTPIPHPGGVLNPATGRPLPPVNLTRATKLHELMVTIACKGHAGGLSYLKWQTAAFDRIGRCTGRGAEQAFIDWRDEVIARTGMQPPML